jgi:hypothetical protein
LRIKKFIFANVTGSGSMKDMLRYDAGFTAAPEPEPNTFERRTALVVFPIFHTPHGDFGGQITVARWRSWGFTVEFVFVDGSGSTAPAPRPAAMPYLPADFSPESLITYRHPWLDDMGKADFSALVPVALAEYIQAKSIEALDRAVFERMKGELCASR